ncbi:MAG: aminotransferase class V-fold PLP-dependent enzyme [Thermoplasmatota archaeon]
MPRAEEIRKDFPILEQEVHGKRLVYLDNAATTQKPRAVIEAMDRYYAETNSNVHRSIHELGERATAAYIDAHEKAARFVGGRSYQEVVFTKNCTESINLVAYSMRRRLQPGDEILITRMEHHSNFVPWQQIAKQTGAKLVIAPVSQEGRLDMAAFAKLVTRRTKLVSVTGMSNVLGTQPDLRSISQISHEAGALVLVDGAQSVPHGPTDVEKMGCDLLAFSGHKMLGPTGIGVLWGKPEVLTSLDPFLFGGEMIKRVTETETTWNDIPWKFEAGTPVIAEAVGLSAAIDYLNHLGMGWIRDQERELTRYALKRLGDIPNLRIYGPPAEERGGVVAFTFDDIHAHDLASILDEEGIAIRAGHHCAQPLMQFLNVPSTARASFYVYTLRDEIDALATALQKARAVFRLA